MHGTVVQINRSKGGIPKTSVNEVFVSERGVDGDDWIHKRFHGGPKQALLLIAVETLEELRAEGFDLFPGALGENLTVRGLDRRVLEHVGCVVLVSPTFGSNGLVRNLLAGLGVDAEVSGEVADRDDLATQRDDTADPVHVRRDGARLRVADDLLDLVDRERVLLVAEGEDDDLPVGGFSHVLLLLAQVG